MKRIIVIAALLAASAAQAEGLDCDLYRHAPAAPVTTEDFEMTGRCQLGRVLIDPECQVVEGEAFGSVERVSERSVKCYYAGLVQNYEVDSDGNLIDGTGEYNYSVAVTGLCCK